MLSFQATLLSLRKNFIWNLVGNVVYAACQWGMVVVLARMTNPEMVGEFALGLAVAGPVFMMSQLKLRGVQATDSRNEYSFGHYLGLRLVTTAVAAGVVAAIAWGGHDFRGGAVIMAVGLFKGVESVSDVFYGLMQKHERMDRIAISRLIKGPLALCAMTISVALTQDVLWGVLAMLAVMAGGACCFDAPNGACVLASSGGDRSEWAIRPVFEWRKLLALSWLALPLGMVSVIVSLQTNVPRYRIAQCFGRSELGLFAALAYLVVAGGVVIAAMGQSVTPRLATYFADGRLDQFKALLRRLLAFGLALGVASIAVSAWAGKPLLSLLYGPPYAARQPVLVVLMAGGAFNYVSSFILCGILATRHFAIQLPIAGVSLGATCAAAHILVPRMGLMGAALSLVLGSMLSAGCYGVALGGILRRAQRKRGASVASCRQSKGGAAR